MNCSIVSHLENQGRCGRAHLDSSTQNANSGGSVRGQGQPSLHRKL